MARVGKKGRNYGRGIVGIWQREVGDLSPRNFAHLVGASEIGNIRLSGSAAVLSCGQLSEHQLKLHLDLCAAVGAAAKLAEFGIATVKKS